MKYVGILSAGICSFIIILASLYYNCVTIDMNNIKSYIIETNTIYNDLLTEEKAINQKEEYIERLEKIKSGLENSTTTHYMNKYKKLKIKQIDKIMDNLKGKNDREIYVDAINYYNNKGNLEITNLTNKNFIEVTYLSIKSYIKI